MGNFFLIHKTIEKYIFFFFQPILKSSDLTNPRYIEQNFSISSDFLKTRLHCIFPPWSLFQAFILLEEMN